MYAPTTTNPRTSKNETHHTKRNKNHKDNPLQHKKPTKIQLYRTPILIKTAQQLQTHNARNFRSNDGYPFPLYTVHHYPPPLNLNHILPNPIPTPLYPLILSRLSPPPNLYPFSSPSIHLLPHHQLHPHPSRNLQTRFCYPVLDCCMVYTPLRRSRVKHEIWQWES